MCRDFCYNAAMMAQGPGALPAVGRWSIRSERIGSAAIRSASSKTVVGAS
jgi:hypothetical protein